VICDDGLQHLRLARQFEIAVMDAARGLGNGHLLPAGPLREPGRRLASVDAIVLADRDDGPVADLATYGRPVFRVAMRPGVAVNLRDGTRRPLAAFSDRPVHAVAAIGHPEAFFAALRATGLGIVASAFPDHEPIRENTLAEFGEATVLMTEKDAVKCRGLVRPGWWYVDLEMSFQPPQAADELVAAVLAVARSSGSGGEHLG
jgi:tetraacyldisaccharide 4'-kinase